jgi:hypothetical protein
VPKHKKPGAFLSLRDSSVAQGQQGGPLTRGRFRVIGTAGIAELGGVLEIAEASETTEFFTTEAAEQAEQKDSKTIVSANSAISVVINLLAQ